MQKESAHAHDSIRRRNKRGADCQILLRGPTYFRTVPRSSRCGIAGTGPGADGLPIYRQMRRMGVLQGQQLDHNPGRWPVAHSTSLVVPSTLLVNVILLETDPPTELRHDEPLKMAGYYWQFRHGPDVRRRRVGDRFASKHRGTLQVVQVLYSVSSPDLEILTSLVGLSRPSVCMQANF